MLKLTRFSLGFLFLLGCGAYTLAQKVEVDWDHNANFEGFHTYAWAPGTPASSLWDQRITGDVDQQLAAKGLQKVDSNGNPDLVVIYHAAVGQDTQYDTMNMGGWGWWGGGMSTTTVEKIPTSTLIVDIGNAKTKKMLWKGTASDTLSDNPNKNRDTLEKSIDKMFKKFPPPEK